MQRFISIDDYIAYYEMFPTDFFETKTQRKILRILAEKNKQYTLDEIAEMCHRSKSSVSRALKDCEKYPFIKKTNLPGSKQLVFGLNPESRYTEAIRQFFSEERNRERQNGTIPVDIWNLLEDLTNKFSQKIDGFVELFLFGSYATGEYHTKSDIDLILLHTPEEDVIKKIDSVAGEVEEKRIQVEDVEIKKREAEKLDGDKIENLVRERGPIRKVDTLIPLSGRVSL